MDKPNVDQIIVRTKEEADRVVDAMSKLLKRHGVLYVSDLKVMVGLDASYIDEKWGWTTLDSMNISEVNDGFSINLPSIEQF
jgi:hypothetical protein